MSSVCLNVVKNLSIGLVMVGGFSISYAANTQHPVKVEASFQQAARINAQESRSSYGSVALTAFGRYTQPYIQPFMVATQVAETKRFIQPRHYVAAAAPRRGGDAAERVINVGSKQLGKKYRWGGENPLSGFDCSGLVQYSMKTGAGVVLPRTAADQYAVSTKVPAAQAMRGDLVFFNTSRRKRISHVGIYLGNNIFLHAPRAGKRIERAVISGYWQNRLIGFGRLPGACKIPAYYG